MSKAVEALEMGEAVMLCGDTSEYDMFLCVGIMAGGLSGVTRWDVFAWAYAVVVRCGAELLGVSRVEAMG